MWIRLGGTGSGWERPCRRNKTNPEISFKSTSDVWSDKVKDARSPFLSPSCPHFGERYKIGGRLVSSSPLGWKLIVIKWPRKMRPRGSSQPSGSPKGVVTQLFRIQICSYSILCEPRVGAGGWQKYWMSVFWLQFGATVAGRVWDCGKSRPGRGISGDQFTPCRKFFIRLLVKVSAVHFTPCRKFLSDY